jgi:hypothetical protein
MIETRVLKRLLEIWESLGYDAFKLEIKELGLLKKGFTIKQIKKVILEDNEIINGYVQVSSFIVKEIS